MEEGEAVVVLEAMKMETIVRAPVAGIVHQLHTDVGVSVQAEDLLIVLDAK